MGKVPKGPFGGLLLPLITTAIYLYFYLYYYYKAEGK
jgi:hypothetical protein